MSLQDVQARAQAATLTVAAVIARPQDIPVFSDAFLDLARAHRDALRRGLDQDLSERPMAERCAAAGLLTEVDPSAAVRRLTALLEDPELDVAHADRVILDLWRALRPFDGPRPALEADRVFAALQGWAGRIKPMRRAQFPQIFQHIPSAQARAALGAGLGDAASRVRAESALALTRLGDGAGLPVIEQIIEGTFEAAERYDYAAIRALKALAEGTDRPDIRAAAFAIAERALSQMLADGNARLANRVSNLLDVLETAPVAVASCERVLAARSLGWVRGRAFERLCTALGADIGPRIGPALGDDDLAKAACAAAARLGAAAGADPEIVAAIVRRLSDPRVADAAARAMIAMGHLHDASLTRHSQHLSPMQRFDIQLMRRAPDRGALLDVIAALELAPPGIIETARMAPATIEGDKLGCDGFYTVLFAAGAFLHFDTEDSRVPPNYVSLFSQLGDLLAPRFSIDHIGMCEMTGPDAPETTPTEAASPGRGAQEPQPQAPASQEPASKAPHGQKRTWVEVTFLFDGAPSLFTPAPIGDWFDLAGALSHLNDLIHASGRPERCVTLYTGDQTAIVVLGHGDKMRAAVSDIDFPMEEDPGAAAAAGQAFERRVLEHLRGQG